MLIYVISHKLVWNKNSCQEASLVNWSQTEVGVNIDF